MSHLGGEAGRLFSHCFGGSPEGVWHAPGRVNLIGEHTDYNDGWVMPFGIDRGITVAARPRTDGRLVCVSSEMGDAEPVALDEIAPGRVRGWVAYVAGVTALLRPHAAALTGLEMAFASDLPPGAGLSSSAALECATAMAVAELFEIDLSRRDLARVGQRAEHEYAGVPCGIMDQTASMCARASHVLLLDTRLLTIEQIPAALPGYAFVVLDTRVKHELGTAPYAERRRSCEEVARALGIRALRDATLDMLERSNLQPLALRRARHVVTENERVLRAADAARAGDVQTLGRLLDASHASLRDDFEVSSKELNVAVEAARAAGAAGARMTGAGFGGSALALSPVDATATLEHHVRSAFAAQGFWPPETFVVTPSDGASRLE